MKSQVTGGLEFGGPRTLQKNRVIHPTFFGESNDS